MLVRRRGRTAWTVPLLLFLAVLLVAGLVFNLANLDTGGESVPRIPGSGGTPPESESIIGLLPLIHIVVSVGGIVFIGAVVYVFLRRKKGPRKSDRVGPRNDFVRAVIFMIAFLLILAAWRQAEPPEEGSEPAPGDGDGDGGIGIPPPPAVAGIPLGVFLAASLFAGLLVLAAFFRPGRYARPSSAVPRAFGPRAAASEAVDRAIASIELGDDVRSAILLCFRRFCELLGARGVHAQEVLTPREIEALAVARLRVSPEDAGDLTDLFEEARYSEHALTEPDRGRALASLARIRAALEG